MVLRAKATAEWQDSLLAGRARGMSSSVIRDLLALTPSGYTGLAAALVAHIENE